MKGSVGCLFSPVPSRPLDNFSASTFFTRCSRATQNKPISWFWSSKIVKGSVRYCIHSAKPSEFSNPQEIRNAFLFQTTACTNFGVFYWLIVWVCRNRISKSWLARDHLSRVLCSILRSRGSRTVKMLVGRYVQSGFILVMRLRIYWTTNAFWCGRLGMSLKPLFHLPYPTDPFTIVEYTDQEIN